MKELTPTQVRLVRLALVVALLAVWEIYARFISTSSLIAGPSDVAMAWWPKVMGEPRVRTAVGITLIELAVAFGLSVVLGMLIGILIGLSEIGRRSLYPLVLLLYGIPQAILLPLFVLIFGLGPAGKIAFGFTPRHFPGDRHDHRRHAQRQSALARRLAPRWARPGRSRCATSSSRTW